MATLLITSNHRFISSKILPTINSSGQWSYLLAKSCRLFSDGQKNSNLSAMIPTADDTQKIKTILPSISPTYQSFQVSSPKKIVVSENNQVFINYRGVQLSHNFVSHLTDAFERHGIKFFVDKDEQRGKDLKHLFVRIDESRIALVIFSTRYPQSKWCMDELVKIKKRSDEGNLQIIPIFYKVDASDVRKPTCNSAFGKNFWRLMETSDRRAPIQEWREALECISNKMGLTLRDNRSEAEFVKNIVKEVERVNEAIGQEKEENHGGKVREKYFS